MENQQQPTPWRTVAQAAAGAQTGERLIYREVKAGRLKAARVGARRELRLRDDWIDAWLESTATLEGGRSASHRATSTRSRRSASRRTRST
jgi:excisionase family DNA binding protein